MKNKKNNDRSSNSVFGYTATNKTVIFFRRIENVKEEEIESYMVESLPYQDFESYSY
jgi:hypothetical protein